MDLVWGEAVYEQLVFLLFRGVGGFGICLVTDRFDWPYIFGIHPFGEAFEGDMSGILEVGGLSSATSLGCHAAMRLPLVTAIHVLYNLESLCLIICLNSSHFLHLLKPSLNSCLNVTSELSSVHAGLFPGFSLSILSSRQAAERCLSLEDKIFAQKLVEGNIVQCKVLKWVDMLHEFIAAAVFTE